ncbi:hypothetical protein DACRYDRAFT_17440 [Dacryopinax primogenitus]|uniref:Uncharacterized protein n=1 Tax=Dacryopinax primogenitus (strain DJM 731) TaxID=1858805 RepID=M5FQP6_DACPD|nr:uncharacterized protein DACRYDRAFT_17440 [Dacryopinax primogenitus]EJT99245.1 hypothetical protein DACRYDRAFT_17440 [Dacryopinax primogenitus]
MDSPPQLVSPWKVACFKDGPEATTLDDFRMLLEHAYKDDPLQIIIDLNRWADTPPVPLTGTRMTDITSFLFEQFHLRRTHELVFLSDPRAPEPKLTNVVWGDNPPDDPYVLGQFYCPVTGLPLGTLENLVIMFGTFAHTGRINNFFRNCTNLRFMTIWSNTTPRSTRRLNMPPNASSINPINLKKLVHADLTLSFARCIEEMRFQMPALVHLPVVLDDSSSPAEHMIFSFARSIRIAKLAGAYSDEHLETFVRNHWNVEGLVLDCCPVGAAFVDFLTSPSLHARYFALNLTHLSIRASSIGDSNVLRICQQRERLQIWLIDCPNTSVGLGAHQTNGRVTRHAGQEEFWKAREASGNPDYPLPRMDAGLQRELYMTEPEL